MILLEGSMRTRHIVLPDLIKDLIRNPSPTHLRHLRIHHSNLITSLIGTESLPQYHLDLLHLLKKSKRNLLEKEAASGVGRQDMC